MRKKSAVILIISQIICCSLCVLIASAATNSKTVATNQPSAAAAATTKIQNGQHFDKGCTDLAPDEETLMVFSTLGGGLAAIDPITSEIRWTIADDPPVMAEQQQNVHVPQYLPDPRDGSIYQLGDMGNLKKLPYTIPQLVASAPCRSSDGILYSGKKSDTWFIVDPKTGRREKVMGFGGKVDNTKNDGEKIGWATSRAIYLGRTQYTVMMYDSLSKDENVKPWNITFYDYSAQTITPDITKEYDYIHLTTTSNGNIVTLDRKDGKFLWKRDLDSPVVAAFLLSKEGLLSVPFTTVSDEAFDAILEESKGGNVNTVKLFQSLYVGEHQHGLYALPSLVDKNTPRISTAPPIKLLDGPSHNNVNSEEEMNTVYLNDVIEKNMGIVLGHYNVPLDKNLQISPSPQTNSDLATIRDFPDASLQANGYVLSTGTQKNTADIGVQTEPRQIESNNAFNKTKKIILANSGKVQKFINDWFMEHPSSRAHQIMIVMVLAMFGMFWYMCSTVRELKSQSENGSRTYTVTSRNSSGNSNISAQDLIDLGDGHIRVGKISFNSNEVLGKGCEGTFVFKGTFEERFVAVKRLLPECFTFADREVALLRESDAHENVVRYFCTEQDRQFRYIAVELCAATLQDYTEGDRRDDFRKNIDVLEVMRQSAAGLNHLHSLNIVHRDIKPQNVLLSLPDVNGAVRVMISDFGLCKKLNFGKTSFSRRSGVTGTEGWIAPEMMRAQRTTTSVDIFSLGCVYYYVLSGGHHAFGDTLKRQANILSNDYNLSKLQTSTSVAESKAVLAEQLIADMIHKDSNNRPPARCIGNHPLFWNDQKILAFLQDVSDRVEKAQFNIEPLKSLEKNGRMVVLDDWNLHLDPIITDDLRKYRGYMGASVRDLLRALRNKKHHYHELTTEVQEILGCIPHEFTNYWVNKFPLLISHTYHAFSICSKESVFKPYYNADYKFTRPEYFDANDSLYPLLVRDPKPLKPSGSVSSPKRGAHQQQPHQQQALTSQQQQALSPQQQVIKYRKGAYNFRKNMPQNDDANNTLTPGVGLHRNLVLPGGGFNVVGGGVGDDADADSLNKHDAFANFKFRRYQKATNRNSNNFNKNNVANNNQGQNNSEAAAVSIDKNEKHIAWTMKTTVEKE